jgi:hypothetical protein
MKPKNVSHLFNLIPKRSISWSLGQLQLLGFSHRNTLSDNPIWKQLSSKLKFYFVLKLKSQNNVILG